MSGHNVTAITIGERATTYMPRAPDIHLKKLNCNTDPVQLESGQMPSVDTKTQTDTGEATRSEITARAALLLSPERNELTLAEIVLDSPNKDEVLIGVRASSLCHSDWNFVEVDYGRPYPELLGHEFSGVVEAVGSDVVGVAVGDHVVACPISACGRCERCVEGDRIACRHPEQSVRGPQQSPRVTHGDTPVWTLSGLGGFATRALVHQSQVVTVDPSLPFDRAAVLGCAVATGAGAVIRSAEVQPRDTVIVFGAGGVGLAAVQAAALVGARKVIVVDVTDEKLEFARRFGATHVVNAIEQNVEEVVSAITNGFGVDHAFEVTGLPKPLEQAYGVLGRGGTVYLVGMQRLGSSFDLPSSDLRSERAVRAVMAGSSNFATDIPYYAELYLQGRFNLDDLIQKHISLEDINAGYAELLAGSVAGRTVIIM
ncbi:zinc-binding dehydrogenase [Rhodococcus sp. T2V]|uniref:zinc-binding dehydrogenase n=1 Tax=Rhodococcus sp. T2V TaxID=3034164 RepID=UPI0023E10657|nr:zinc-binding dehydrogenase [Rhodococcus sp. T2V]MDF3313224.1 zinc-binding dehydrogenase [Rhodococcus sp. T2V]